MFSCTRVVLWTLNTLYGQVLRGCIFLFHYDKICFFTYSHVYTLEVDVEWITVVRRWLCDRLSNTYIIHYIFITLNTISNMKL